ncbi:MAG TPA: virulence RhuM family protein [Rickettsia endosymbiont of Omalisus fontisbellaquei]|nr:virulence RhuM family protein [Rickettsia endosymbiont of Omalisus fontisbellaquei]
MAYAYKKCLEKAAIAFFATVQIEGKKSVERQIEYYNLDAIILVGYRVNSMSFLAKSGPVVWLVLCHSRGSGNPLLIISVSAVNFYNRLLSLFNFFLDSRFRGNDIEPCG